MNSGGDRLIGLVGYTVIVSRGAIAMMGARPSSVEVLVCGGKRSGACLPLVLKDFLCFLLESPPATQKRHTLPEYGGIQYGRGQWRRVFLPST